ncbi:hypothetical protein GMDG_00112 [Pseudogymnoascus destructans 20631-21]|uniref:Ribonuclease H2 subunit B n=1 Tax=Pseudogymnoascus destructans (strain ATCC MYA-4855 / 20631-21) TaxID=658429 RepID=L8FPW2_PSED2|nr:hypothetical protein GMDG_00112 [Pseudogymnoascus destructans 20631-21]
MAPSTTRSKAKAKGPAPNTGPGATSATTQKKPVRPDSKNPPKLFVLPKDTSPTARIATLAHPRTSEPTRYFICPEKGFFEFTKIAAPKSQPRSWLLAPNEEECANEGSQTTGNGENKAAEKDEGNEYTPSEGYITSSADLFLATPIDPLFLLLPALAGKSSKPREEPKRLFLEADDYLDVLSSTSPHLKSLLGQDSLRSKFTDRLGAVCDTVDAGETMYRLSEPKLIAILAEKCAAVIEKGLPASMEDLLVSKALAVPLLSITRGEDCPDEELELADANSSATPKTESAESQTPSSATESSATPVSEASTALTTPSPDAKPPIVAPEGVPHLLRLRTAFQYLCSSYIPAALSTSLASKFNTPPPTKHRLFETSPP